MLFRTCSRGNQKNLPENVTRKSIVVNFYKEESLDIVPLRTLTTWDSSEEEFFVKKSLSKLYHWCLLNQGYISNRISNLKVLTISNKKIKNLIHLVFNLMQFIS